MQATHGFAVPFRRLGGCLFALALVISAVLASSAAAEKIPVTHSDLALGDSLAFGYSQQIFNEQLETTGTAAATAFEHGYANYYFNISKAKAAGDQLINNGCPGETTDSMIGNGPMAIALGETEGESPCAYHKKGFPLHHEYGGVSQLENAIGTIGALAVAGKPVTTITMNIGANDELRAIKKCEEEAKPAEEAAFIKALSEGKSEAEAAKAAEEAGKASVKKCVESHAEEIFTHILRNIGRMVTALRHGSLFGGVDYTGKIAFPGSYDPYGVVFAKGEPIGPSGEFGTATGEEVLPGSTALSALLNFHENKLLTDENPAAAEEGHEPFHACFVNSIQPKFNTANKKTEPERLKAWTNMANYKVNLGLTYKQKAGELSADGPDIHPTPTGYHEMALLMSKECGPVE